MASVMASHLRTLYAFLTLCAVVEHSMLTAAQWQNSDVDCQVSAAQSLEEADYVDSLFAMEDSLLKLQLSVQNYTLNPLLHGNRWSYNTDVWFRASSMKHRRILNTAFSFSGVPPMMALSYVYNPVNVHLREFPTGCLTRVTESQKLDIIQALIMNNLHPANESGPVHKGPVWVCHQMVDKTETGYAKFVIRCCRQRKYHEMDCSTEVAEEWLRLLDIFLISARVIAFLAGPLLIPEFLYSVAEETTKYVVHFTEPYHMRIAVRSVGASPEGVHGKHILDLRKHETWNVCRRQVMRLPRGVPIPIVVRQYRIEVSKRRLLDESCVPVTLFKYIIDFAFFCKLRRSPQLYHFCGQDAFDGLQKCGIRPKKWKDVCNLLGRFLMILLLPLPFYVRFLIYREYEYPELKTRMNVAEHLKLQLLPNHRPLHYITLSHVVFGLAYAIYVVGGLKMATMHARCTKSRYQQPLSDSFTKLKQMQIINDIGILFSKLLWPLARFGVVFGCIVGLFFWPIAIPICVPLGIVYCTPLVYLSVQFVKQVLIIELSDADKNEFVDKPPSGTSLAQTLLTIASILLFIYSIMLMLSEVIGFLVEVICLIIMGMAVDALKYISVVCLLYIYSVDCYGGVRDKYIRLNRQLHDEIKSRIGSDLDDFVSLPQSMREHRAFKASEASEQAPHEKADEIIVKHSLQCWSVNDLVLFVDEHDRPRIPRQLFDDVCNVQLPGSPGPPSRSIARATCKFAMIVSFLFFVFSIVFAFGDSYNVSSVKQLLATLAGGFLPIVFRKVLLIVTPKVRPMTVSFRCRIEEVIRNFRQAWPMCDFPFEVDIEAVRREGYTRSKFKPPANANLVDLLILVPSQAWSPHLKLEIVQ